MGTVKSFSIIAATLLFVIWIAGYIITYTYYMGSEKKECMDEEGFLKGLLWCSSEPSTMREVSYSHSTKMIKSALWPITLFTDTGKEPDSQPVSVDDL